MKNPQSFPWERHKYHNKIPLEEAPSRISSSSQQQQSLGVDSVQQVLKSLSYKERKRSHTDLLAQNAPRQQLNPPKNLSGEGLNRPQPLICVRSPPCVVSSRQKDRCTFASRRLKNACVCVRGLRRTRRRAGNWAHVLARTCVRFLHSRRAQINKQAGCGCRFGGKKLKPCASVFSACQRFVYKYGYWLLLRVQLIMCEICKQNVAHKRQKNNKLRTAFGFFSGLSFSIFL